MHTQNSYYICIVWYAKILWSGNCYLFSIKNEIAFSLNTVFRKNFKWLKFRVLWKKIHIKFLRHVHKICTYRVKTTFSPYNIHCTLASIFTLSSIYISNIHPAQHYDDHPVVSWRKSLPWCWVHRVQKSEECHWSFLHKQRDLDQMFCQS